MANAIPLAELALKMALLPPICRGRRLAGPGGAALAGPRLHAHRLTVLWQVPDDDQVTLSEAFRLLDAEAVEGAIWRVMVARERNGDPRYWTFPEIDELLPALRELAWQDMLAGMLLVEASKGVRGKHYRTILPAELPRLVPDWELSRLVFSGRDEFVDVRVQRAPAEAVKKAWRKKYSHDELKDAAKKIAESCGPGERPSFRDFWDALKVELPDVTKRQAKRALDFEPQLKGQRGHRATTS
jgi:hypothetical protein